MILWMFHSHDRAVASTACPSRLRAHFQRTNRNTVQGKAKEVTWPQKWSSSEPFAHGGSELPVRSLPACPGIRQRHVTILFGISGADLD